jgi:hypothetical protein
MRHDVLGLISVCSGKKARKMKRVHLQLPPVPPTIRKRQNLYSLDALKTVPLILLATDLYTG